MHNLAYSKHKKLYYTIIVFFLFFTHHCIYAEQKIPAPQFLHFLYTKKFSLQLNPSSVFKNTIKEEMETRSPNIGSELKYSFTVPQTYLENINDTDIDLLILQTLLSVRSQKGIQYYSNSRQEYRTFIEDIYTVTSPKNKTPIKDTVPSILQSSINTTIFKQDSSFGTGIFSYNINYKNSHEFLISIENLENVFYGIFILIATPHALMNNILIQRKRNTFTIYATSYSKIHMPFKEIRLRATKSLLYRMFALVQWFEKEINISLQAS